MKTAPRMIVGGLILLFIAALLAPGIKQRMLPSHATPERFDALFPEQISALVEVAERKMKVEDVAHLFSEPAIREAVVVTNYGDGTRAATHVGGRGDYARSGIWFYAEPELDRAVVNIWDQVACFEKKFRTTSGGIRGLVLCVDTEYLKQNETVRREPPEKLGYGENLLRQIVRDRPSMKQHVEPGDRIWSWVSERLDRRIAGMRVVWSAELPLRHHNADHRGDYAAREIVLRTRPSESYEYAWRRVVFELLNMERVADFRQTWEDAFAGRLTRSDWIAKKTGYEFEAVQKTKVFYRTFWRPWAEQRDLPTTGRSWYAGEPDTYDEWFAQFTDRSGYPWREFGGYWDREIAPRLKRSAKPN